MTDATPRVFQTSGKVWLKDFEFGLTGLKVRKTGAHVPYSPSVIAQVTAWFRYFFTAQRIEPIQPRFKIFFAPERARPWYLIWAVSRGESGPNRFGPDPLGTPVGGPGRPWPVGR